MSQKTSQTRVAAIVGPYTSGKTSLLESLLYVTGTIDRKGTAADLTRVGDMTLENKKRQTGVDTTVASARFLDEPWVFLDCPGSSEFIQETYNALSVCDVAIVVCDPDPARAVMAAPLLKYLKDMAVPHLIFINKVENTKAPIREIFDALQAVSGLPLILREIPIREDDKITGFVDLISERAYAFKDGEYKDNVSAHLVKVPDSLRHDEERREMLEQLADHNDALLEKLLEDAVPAQQEVFSGLSAALSENTVVPVFFGAAEQDAGVFRLLKTLRHDVVPLQTVRARLPETAGPAAQIFKTCYAPHIGKLSYARIIDGEISDTASLGAEKINGLYTVQGTKTVKTDVVETGGIAAFGKMDNLKTGDLPTADKRERNPFFPEPLKPVFALALKPKKTGEEVKMSQALAKLCEEDASLQVEFNKDTGQMLLWGQGRTQLETALEKLETRFNVSIEGTKPKTPYKETITKSVKIQGKHKRQSGGHGQYGDVWLEIKPRPRGSGFEFTQTIVGGAVPKQYFSAVEDGVREYLNKGVFGCPVVDLSVNLYDGSYHDVDSSDQAFKTAALTGMREGVPQCGPVLLEPVLALTVSVYPEFTSKAQRAVSQRRGQILGFDGQDKDGMETIQVWLPQSEMADFVIELRSLSMGTGKIDWQFDHLQEAPDKDAEKMMNQNN
ncbi:MAG: elongation factor G [Alphaproteobacteria bacterium]|nr:elongation factor G [Alphaproteobacteria bacterium]